MLRKSEENNPLLGTYAESKASPHPTYLDDNGNELRLSFDASDPKSPTQAAAAPYYYGSFGLFQNDVQDSKNEYDPYDLDLDQLELRGLQEKLKNTTSENERLKQECRQALDLKRDELLAKEKTGAKITPEEDPHCVTGFCFGWGSHYDSNDDRYCCLPCFAATAAFCTTAICMGTCGVCCGAAGPCCCSNSPTYFGLCCQGAYWGNSLTWVSSGCAAGIGAGSCCVYTSAGFEYCHYSFYKDIPADKAEQISRLDLEIADTQKQIEVVEARIAQQRSRLQP
ncbi:MAG: hypothetical protein SFW66_04565 [Gammaproteobacteria bacterium]|nr:hypothetical protein [Gammaproteobacteria bacterium]